MGACQELQAAAELTNENWDCSLQKRLSNIFTQQMEVSIINKLMYVSVTFSHSFHLRWQRESELILQPSKWWVAEISHLSLMSLTRKPIPVSIWQETGEILKSGYPKLRKQFFSWDYTELIKEVGNYTTLQRCALRLQKGWRWTFIWPPTHM